MLFRILALSLDDYNQPILPSMEDLPDLLEQGFAVKAFEFEAPNDELAVHVGRSILWDNNVSAEDTCIEIQRWGDRWDSLSAKCLQPKIIVGYDGIELCEALGVEWSDFLEELSNTNVSWGGVDEAEQPAQKTLCSVQIAYEVCRDIYQGDFDDFQQKWDALNLSVEWVSFD